MKHDPQRSDPRHEEYTPDRRRFLAGFSIGLGALAATALGVPVIGFILAPLLQRTPEVWRPVGKIDGFTVGRTVEIAFEDASPLPWAGAVARTAAWLRRESNNQFVVFSINCTHLGCPVQWEASSSLFFCPCHGGVYYQDGKVAAGPPPLPLPQYPVRLRGGQVEVRTSPIPITRSV